MTFRLLSSGPLRIGLVSGLVVVGLVLSGCAGSGPQGGGTPSASVSETSSATPTPTPTPSAVYKPADAKGRAENVPVPVLPEEAKAETKEGAIAFARHWFAVLSYAYETGDLQEFDRITPPACTSCADARRVIESWHSDGRWLIGGKITTPSIETTFRRAADTNYQMIVQVHQTPLSYIRKDGSVARQDPQADDTANLLLIDFADGKWSLKDVGSVV